MTDTATSTSSSSARKEQSTLVRLGRGVWFTLESSARASRNSTWEALLADAPHDWKTRQAWTDQAWIDFWTIHGLETAAQVFLENAGDVNVEQERELLNALGVYLNFYQALPGVPETTAVANNGETIKSAAKRVDALLGSLQDRLGDPVMPCKVCGKCARGFPLKRCSRCKQAYYCSQDCQKVNWPSHKRACKAPNLKELNQLVSKRYMELRRQGKETKEAMAKARAEYGLTDAKIPNAGAQVAAMFGMPM